MGIVTRIETSTHGPPARRRLAALEGFSTCVQSRSVLRVREASLTVGEKLTPVTLRQCSPTRVVLGLPAPHASPRTASRDGRGRTPSCPGGRRAGCRDLLLDRRASRGTRPVLERGRLVDEGIIEDVLAVYRPAPRCTRGRPYAVLPEPGSSATRRRIRHSPPMSATAREYQAKAPERGENGTCVVPACVKSGHSPETAALRMRSSGTPSTTSRRLDAGYRANGARARLMSSCGCGPWA